VVTSYILEAGYSPEATDVFNGNVGGVLSLSANVGSGTYYVRVRGANSCGVGEASNEVELVVP